MRICAKCGCEMIPEGKLNSYCPVCVEYYQYEELFEEEVVE